VFRVAVAFFCFEFAGVWVSCAECLGCKIGNIAVVVWHSGMSVIAKWYYREMIFLGDALMSVQ